MYVDCGMVDADRINSNGTGKARLFVTLGWEEMCWFLPQNRES